ncbi:hypothetical protein ABZP36_012506 [Zizania latifolia]
MVDGGGHRGTGREEAACAGGCELLLWRQREAWGDAVAEVLARYGGLQPRPEVDGEDEVGGAVDTTLCFALQCRSLAGIRLRVSAVLGLVLLL